MRNLGIIKALLFSFSSVSEFARAPHTSSAGSFHCDLYSLYGGAKKATLMLPYTYKRTHDVNVYSFS